MPSAPLPMLTAPAPNANGTTESCACPTCQGACRSKPGWFKPGEAEKMAEALGITLKECFERYLMVDWWDGDPREGKWEYENVFVLSPAITDGLPGSEFGGDPRGTCLLYQNGLCGIHPVKPFECKAYVHGGKTDAHRQVALAWATPEGQAQIRDLLGREPYATEYYGSGSLLGLGGLFG